MSSSTALIGRGVGAGDAVASGVDVAVGLALTATAGDEAAGGVIAPPQEAKTIAITKSRCPTMLVYRAQREISASARRVRVRRRPRCLRNKWRGRRDWERRAC